MVADHQLHNMIKKIIYVVTFCLLSQVTFAAGDSSGSSSEEDLDKELERLFNEHGINKNDSNINIEMEIDS